MNRYTGTAEEENITWQQSPQAHQQDYQMYLESTDSYDGPTTYMDENSTPVLDTPIAKDAWSPAKYTEFVESAYAHEQSEDAVTPLEQFFLDDVLWHVWRTDEGHVYYLSEDNHSQWGDPRVYGVYTEDTNQNIIEDYDKPPSPSKPSFQKPRIVKQSSHVGSESDDDNSSNVKIRTPIKENHAKYKSPRK